MSSGSKGSSCSWSTTKRANAIRCAGGGAPERTRKGSSTGRSPNLPSITCFRSSSASPSLRESSRTTDPVPEEEALRRTQYAIKTQSRRDQAAIKTRSRRNQDAIKTQSRRNQDAIETQSRRNQVAIETQSTQGESSRTPDRNQYAIKMQSSQSSRTPGLVPPNTASTIAADMELEAHWRGVTPGWP